MLLLLLVAWGPHFKNCWLIYLGYYALGSCRVAAPTHKVSGLMGQGVAWALESAKAPDDSEVETQGPLVRI